MEFGVGENVSKAPGNAMRFETEGCAASERKILIQKMSTIPALRDININSISEYRLENCHASEKT